MASIFQQQLSKMYHYRAAQPLTELLTSRLDNDNEQGTSMMTMPIQLRSIILTILLLLLLPVLTLGSLTRETAAPRGPASRFYDAFSTRIYDPQGRVLQLEYALEATKKGGVAVGAVGKDLAVLASWTPRSSWRQAPAAQQPGSGLWRGDGHVALAGSGLATDVLALAELAGRECLAHRYVHDSPLRVGRLMARLAQEVYDTERNRIVPYAVDLLVAGFDRGSDGGPCLYKVGPAGVVESFKACAVGRGAENARGYLLNHLEDFSSVASSQQERELRHLATTVLRALMLTVTEVEDDTESGKERSMVEEGTNISMVVLGEDIHMPLLVVWDPDRRRMDVRIPATLAAQLEGQEKKEEGKRIA